jgi:CheY-like chemotaxis protein
MDLKEVTVLVVDDEVLVLRMLQRILSSVYREVLLAETPSEAWAALEHKPTHLICDLNLKNPQDNGFTLVPKLREEYDFHRAIILTGSISQEQLLGPFPEGVDAVVTKGTPGRSLLSTLIDVMSGTDVGNVY